MSTITSIRVSGIRNAAPADMEVTSSGAWIGAGDSNASRYISEMMGRLPSRKYRPILSGSDVALVAVSYRGHAPAGKLASYPRKHMLVLLAAAPPAPLNDVPPGGP
jgi:hypothetical protein